MSFQTMSLEEAIHYAKTANNGDIGLNDYPIYDEAHRPVLNQKIINRYINREIGQESLELFTATLNRRMHEIMPPYNELYKSKISLDDALKTVNLRTLTNAVNVQESDTEAESSSDTGTTGASRSVTSNTPNTMLSGDEDYADGAADVTSANNTNESSAQSATTNTRDTANSESTTTGYQGSLSDLLMRYRATILNVDLMIVEDIRDCFLGVYDNGDEYLPDGYRNHYLSRGYFL